MTKSKSSSSMNNDMMMSMGCCTSQSGVTHLLLGAGVALLAVEYLKLGSIGMWGWLLVGIGVVAHFFKMK